MPETVPNLAVTPPANDVQIRQQPHGFLVVNAILHDPGRAKPITLEIAGIEFRVRIAVATLRSAPSLSGEWRATLNLRSGMGGSLEGVQFVRRLRPLTAARRAQPAFWTCTGEIARVEPTAGLIVLRVEEPRGGHGTFAVTARAEQELLEPLIGARFAHLTGSLDGVNLVTARAESLEMGQLELSAVALREQLESADPNLEG